MRLLTLEDYPGSPVTKMKYFLEPETDTQKRFDGYKKWWSYHMDAISPDLRDGYYIICDCVF